MSEWKRVKLEEIADVQTGPFGSQLHQEDYVACGTPIITVEHLGDNIIIHNNLPMVSDFDKERLSKYILREGDIVFSRVGSVDRCAYVRKNEDGWLFSGRCLRIRVNRNIINPRYLSFYFGNQNFKEFIRQIAVGATMPSLNTKLMSEIEIPVPPLPVQKKIASILSSLDDKIELNTRMNKVLEEIAQALFKRWFVDFEFPNGQGKPYKSSGGKMVESEIGLVPAGWNVKEYASFLTARKEKSSDPEIPEYSVTNEGLFPRDEKFSKKLSLKGSGNKIMYKTDLVFGNSRHTLNWGIMKEEIGGISTAYQVFCVDSSVNSQYLELYMLSHLTYFSDIINIGSTRDNQGIDKTMLMRKLIYLPPEDLLKRFFMIYDKIQDKILANGKENKRLADIRDTLLPKLMSGEIIIKN